MLATMRVVPILCAGLMVQAAGARASAQSGAPTAESLMREGTRAQEHGDLKAAIADFKKALALNPDLAEAHANLGAALAAAGEVPEAIQHDRRALEASPQNEA